MTPDSSGPASRTSTPTLPSPGTATQPPSRPPNRLEADEQASEPNMANIKIRPVTPTAIRPIHPMPMRLSANNVDCQSAPRSPRGEMRNYVSRRCGDSVVRDVRPRFKNRGVTAKITDGRNATVAALLVIIVSATSTPSRTWTLKSDSVRHR